MARYQDLYVQAEEELTRLKKERSSIDRLMMHATAFEAAMKVLARHNLMTEFADEITAAPTTAVTNGARGTEER